MLLGMLALSAMGLVAMLTTLPPLLPLWLGAAGALLLWLWRGGSSFLLLVLWLLLLIRGVGWCEAQLQNRVATDFESVDVWLEGYVEGLPAHLPGRQRFDFRVLAAQLAATGEAVEFPRRVRLSLYDERGADARPQLRLAGGEGRRLQVRVKQPRGFANPGGFDYELWLFNRGIGARGYVRQLDPGVPVRAPAALLAAWRERLRGVFLERVASPRAAAVLLALGLGDKSYINRQDRDLIRAAGLSHLLAISGLHVGMVAAVGFLLGRLLGGGLSLIWPVRVFGPRLGVGLGLLVAALYALLSGLGIPAQRALIMLSVAALWYLSNRRYSAWQGWWLALVVVLCWQPLALLEAGFWFSFAAVACLLLLGSRHRPAGRRWLELLGLQLGLFLLLSVLQWYWGLGVNPLSPLINLLAIPFVSVAIVPLVLLALLLAALSPAAAELPLNLAAWFCHGLWWLLDAAQPLLVDLYLQPAQLPSAATLAVVLVAAVVVLLPLRPELRGLGLLSAVLAMLLRPPATVGAEVTILDVGQGLAVVVQSGGEVLLYDAGPSFSSGFDAGEVLVVPFLRQAGIRHLDLLVVSHNDNDHAGGVAAVNQSLSVGRVLRGEEAPTPDNEPLRGVAVDLCGQDRHLRLGSVDVYVLGLAGFPAANGNDRSCVLLLEQGGYRILLPGDIEKGREQELLAHPWLNEPVDLLLAPHHGSNTSSTPAWVRQLQPAQVIFSAGYRSRYRHPSPAVVARYRRGGAQIYCTGISGALQLRLEPGQQPRLQGWRSSSGRLWRFAGDNGCR